MRAKKSKQEAREESAVVKTIGAWANDHLLFKLASVKLGLDMRDAFTQASREWIGRYAPEILKDEPPRKNQAA